MNELTRNKLKENATRILEFQSLELGVQSLVKPLLNKTFQSTLKLLEVISEYGDEGITYQELGEIVGHHPTSVSQKLNALDDGGYPLILDDESARIESIHTGRFRRKVSI